MVTPDTAAVLGIAAFATGVTGLVKKANVQGEWLVLVCVAAGAFATYMTEYQPALWASLSMLAIGGAATGNVSLLKELAQTLGGTSQG
jgi:hypothetical protein